MTSTLKDQQRPPAHTTPTAAAAAAAPPVDAAASKHRLSCTACSARGNHRYAAAPSQQASPSSSRRNSQLKNLTPLSNYSNSSQDSLITHKSNTNNNNIIIHNNNSSSSNSSPHHNTNIINKTDTLDLTNLSSSSSPLQASSGFKLNFNTSHSQPKIKCHIDHLHQDLELDLKLDGNEDNNINDMYSNNNSSSSSRFTLNCYNPNDPNNNIKLRVELVKTSAKGFGLKIMQHIPPSLINEASLAIKKEKSKRDRSESSRNIIPKSNDISDLDEVRISSGTISNEYDGEHHCNCTTPCGAPTCKAAIIILKDQEVNSL